MEKRVLSPFLPTYQRARRFLRIVDGASFSQYQAMNSEIKSHRGNRPNKTNWTEPEAWIPERLTGKSQALAYRIWRESNQLLNPAGKPGELKLCETHGLIAYPDDIFIITEDGEKFLQNEESMLRKIDEYEGMLLILTEVADKGPGQRNDFLEGYQAFCLTSTTYAAEASITSSLSARLKNLAARNYIEKSGHSYQVTNLGLAYLQRGQGSSRISRLYESAKRISSDTRKRLARHLQEMNPYKFEGLIKHLLEEMGYDDVEVTSPTNDKGVDVVADIELGISKVREVIQVKRQKTNIGRPTLDGLRGSLHRFDAVRATIITTGGFSKGAKDAAFEKGAAPITLIDGEKLMDLLIENHIGVHKREIKVLEFDPAKLNSFEAEDEAHGTHLNHGRESRHRL